MSDFAYANEVHDDGALRNDANCDDGESSSLSRVSFEKKCDYNTHTGILLDDDTTRTIIHADNRMTPVTSNISTHVTAGVTFVQSHLASSSNTPRTLRII